jgi:hypothetical protein
MIREALLVHLADYVDMHEELIKSEEHASKS